MQKLKFWFIILIFDFGILNFMGCAPEPYIKVPKVIGAAGVYHRVEKGQTLWRISKIYNIELDELAKANNISDAASIEINQLIIIPNRQQRLAVPTTGSSDDFNWPMRGKIISTFSSTYRNMINRGINIAPYNSLDVVAARAGRVVFYSDNFGNYGKTLIIDHGDGYSTIYARNAKIFVKIGDNIQKGALISKAGSAGRDKSTYLHFEIRKAALAQNPLFYLPH